MKRRQTPRGGQGTLAAPAGKHFKTRRFAAWAQKTVLLPAAILLLTLGVFPCAANAETGSTVRVGIFDYQAFYGKDAGGREAGYGYEYLQTLARYGGFRFEFVYGSWAECLAWLENGTIDMLDSAQKSPEREEKFLFSAYSTGTSYGELFVREDNTDIAYNDFPAMNGLTVGMLEGNSRNEAFLSYAIQNGFTVRTVLFETAAELSAALQEGRVDAIVSSNLRQGEGERPIARFSPTPFYIMINRNLPELKARIDAALEEILIDYPNFNSGLNQKYYTDHSATPMLTRTEHEYVRGAPVLRVVYNSNWRPFVFFSAGRETAEGINVDLLNLIGGKTGLRFEYLNTGSYEQAVNMVEAGEADLLLGFDLGAEKADEMNVTATDVFLSVPLCFIGKSAAVHEGAVFALPSRHPEMLSFVKQQFPGGAVVEYDTAPECYQAVLQGRADFTMDNMYTATDLIGSGAYGDLLVAMASPLKASYAFGLSPGANPTLVRVLNKGIATVTEEEINSIFMYHTVNQIPASSRSALLEQYRPYLIFAGAAAGVLLLLLLLLYADRQMKNKQRLWQTAYIDSLTGIGNLNLFKEELRTLLDKNPQTRYVVCKLDIENLKLLNEIYGFDSVDEILKALAQTLAGVAVPGADAYARISGDDFILLKSYEQEEDNDTLLEKSEQAFLASIGQEFEHLVKLKFGAYYIQNNSESVASILEKAYYAHGICKTNPTLHAFVYDEGIKQRAIEEKKLEARMDGALAKKQFMMYLQPKFYLHNEAIAGAEALVRWCSEDGTDLLYPGSFIPLFEKNGFITKLDMYMLERSCELIRAWMDSGTTPITISINFSRLHLLNPNFTQDICAVTDYYRIPRQYIEIELTESTMFNNEETMMAVLESLHELGFTLSMDDFGTGYSSLGLLKNLPVDVIKIDRGFFTNNRYKTRAKAVLSHVMQMAKRLSIHTVAEGVESEEDICFLREMGCDIVQGYYFSKPVPAHEMALEKAPRPIRPSGAQAGVDFAEIGNLIAGRPEMGPDMPVLVYRLFLLSLRKKLATTYGEGEMADLLRDVGRLAGNAFARSVLDVSLPPDAFLAQLSRELARMKMGQLHVDSFDPVSGKGVFSISDDLDCSGMANRQETMCQYDEGLIAGILEEYTCHTYSVVEVACWGTGATACRFEANPK